MAGWDPPPVNVTVYGSAARGDGDLDSDIDIDIDILVVAPDSALPGGYTWHGTAGGELLDRLHAWTGNRAEITEYPLSEVRAIAAADAICCIRLGTRSADDDHQAASALAARADPDAGKALGRVLSVKHSRQRPW